MSLKIGDVVRILKDPHIKSRLRDKLARVIELEK